jgi:hypothetical protein
MPNQNLSGLAKCYSKIFPAWHFVFLCHEKEKNWYIWNTSSGAVDFQRRDIFWELPRKHCPGILIFLPGSFSLNFASEFE